VQANISQVVLVYTICNVNWNRSNRAILFVAVKLNAGRNVVGVLRGFDQFLNLVLDNTVEINGADKNEIGMVVRPLLLAF